MIHPITNMSILIGIVGGAFVIATLVLSVAWIACRSMDEDAETTKQIEKWRDGK